MNVFRSGFIFVRKEIIENKIIGEIVHAKEKRIIQKEKSVNGVINLWRKTHRLACGMKAPFPTFFLH